ncbi:hypothetical protein BpHYR1_012768 [Brachionus plicatilis]|uniref:Uncharacterized protein n=1 Tax=Brachionus plicatilis TaxID=10195 RepID=A0A3M7ST83_BRAPC|nr:hypothetical protein BpHYR1_012768 [Brachionus plicatilis]
MKFDQKFYFATSYSVVESQFNRKKETCGTRLDIFFSSFSKILNRWKHEPYQTNLEVLHLIDII